MLLIVSKSRHWNNNPVKAKTGYIPILPNKNHDYYELSPMILGLIHTDETEFPMVYNLKNYWQSSKVFDIDLGLDKLISQKYKRDMRPICTIFYDGDLLSGLR